MNVQQSTNNDLSQHLRCPRCHTSLPLNAMFCTVCGQQIQAKENTLREDFPEEMQEDDDDTIRLPAVRISPSSRHTNASEAYEGDTVRLKAIRVFPPAVSTNETVQEKPLQIPQSEAETVLITNQVLTSSVPDIESIEPDDASPTSLHPHALSVDDLWNGVSILSAAAALLTNFVIVNTFIRPFIMFWFLSFCPGMMVVRILRIRGAVVEWILAVTLSLVIDTTVAGLQLYTGWWSPDGTLSILAGLTIGVAVVQGAMSRYHRH